VSGVTVTADDDGTGATTTHTVSFSDDTDAGDIDELTIDYEATDVSDVTADDTTVTWAGDRPNGLERRGCRRHDAYSHDRQRVHAR